MVSKVGATIPPNQAIHGGPEHPSTCSSTWKKVRCAVLETFKFMENILWNYVKELNSIAKRVIKVIATACSKLQNKLNSVIAKLGILSAISFLLTLKEMPSQLKSLIEQIKLRDGEGIAFSVLSLIVAPLDALDSLITTLGGLAAFGVIPAIAFFSLIGLPLAIGLVGYGCFKGLYDIIRRGINLNALPKAIKSDNLESFKTYIEKKIAVTAQEKKRIEQQALSSKDPKKFIERRIKVIKDRKRNAFTRHTDAKVYNIMANLKNHLSTDSPDLETANKALGDMKKILRRKISLGSVGLSGNVALGATLVSAAFFPISALAIPIVAGVRSAMALGRHHYEHAWMYKGLSLPAFTKLSAA